VTTRDIAAVCILATLSTGQAARAQIPADITTAGNQYIAAWKSRDIGRQIDWARAHLAPDWTQKELDGSIVTRDQFIRQADEMRVRGVPPYTVNGAELRIDRFRARGATIVMWITETHDQKAADLDGRFGRKGESHHLRTIESGKRTWVRARGRWYDMSDEILSSRLWVDGAQRDSALLFGIPPDPIVKAEIEAAYDGMADALAHKDRDGTLHYFLPGTAEYRDAAANWTKLTASLVSVLDMGAHVESTQEQAGTVVAVVITHFRTRSIDSTGTYGKRGQEHEYLGRFRERATWVKTEGGWKLKGGKTLSGSLLVDGKPRKAT
jgi:hypothetical protein